MDIRTYIPAETNRHKATKVSDDLDFATRLKIFLNAFDPKYMIPPKPSVAFNVKKAIAEYVDPPLSPTPWPAINGSNTNKGATARS